MNIVIYYHRKFPRRQQSTPRLPVLRKQPQQQQRPPTCKRCGKQSHPIQRCTARHVCCNKCNFKGHIARLCLSKTVADVTKVWNSWKMMKVMMKNLSTLIQCTLMQQIVNSAQYGWWQAVSICSNPVKFKVDTRAEVSALSEKTWESLPETTPLHSTTIKLCGADNKPLNVIGETELQLKHKNKTIRQQVFVIKNLRNNLFSSTCNGDCPTS